MRAFDALRLRPPLAFGGHSFVALDHDVWWCPRCLRAVPGWALDEGFWLVLLDRWCPALFDALPVARDQPDSPPGCPESDEPGLPAANTPERT